VARIQVRKLSIRDKIAIERGRHCRDDLKEMFRVRDSYGVDIAAGEDASLILAITVAIDALRERLHLLAGQVACLFDPGDDLALREVVVFVDVEVTHLGML
jgi:hypothetical protein